MLAPLLLDLGRHAVFIWSSYAAVVIVIAVLVVWLIVEGRRYQRRIAQLEVRGTRRRSASQRTDS